MGARPHEGPTRGRVPSKVNQVLNVGDVVYVEPLQTRDEFRRLRQVPDIVRRDRRDGPAHRPRARAWSAASPTTRASSTAPRRRCASRARRSSRSSMRPRSTTATRRRPVVLDAPFAIDQGPGLPLVAPDNYRRQILRPVDAAPRHRAVAQRDDGAARPGHRHAARSPNTRERFGVYDKLPPLPADGARRGETTVLRMATAYSMFVNGGTQDQADAHRPHPGPLRQDHLSGTTSATAASCNAAEVGGPGRSRCSSTTASRCSTR